MRMSAPMNRMTPITRAHIKRRDAAARAPRRCAITHSSKAPVGKHHLVRLRISLDTGDRHPIQPYGAGNLTYRHRPSPKQILYLLKLTAVKRRLAATIGGGVSSPRMRYSGPLGSACEPGRSPP